MIEVKKVEVKVFNANVTNEEEKYYEGLGIQSYNLFEYHNQILRKDGTVKPKYSSRALQPMKPLPQNIETKYKYELDEDEKMAVSMLKSSTRKAEELFDSCKRKEIKYEHMLINKIDFEGPTYDGEHWDCNLSPIGRCIYTTDSCGEYVCIFCGEPEERK